MAPRQTLQQKRWWLNTLAVLTVIDLALLVGVCPQDPVSWPRVVVHAVTGLLLVGSTAITWRTRRKTSRRAGQP